MTEYNITIVTRMQKTHMYTIKVDDDSKLLDAINGALKILEIPQRLIKTLHIDRVTDYTNPV